MKRFLSIILCVSILVLSCCMVSFANDGVPASIESPYEAGLLSYLGVMNGTKNADWGKSITRADFALYVYNIAKLYGGEVKPYYTDVPKGTELEEAVSYLVSAGVLSVPQSRLFRPDEPVIFSEACKMLVSIAGYDDYAKATGGYPTGYLKTANKLGITDGTTGGNELSYRDGAILLYNTLHTGMFDIEYIGEDGFVYTGSETETVLERFFDIYPVEGVVEVKNRIDMSKDGYADKGIMSIDGVVYNDLIESNKLLGYYVEAYVKKNDAGRDSVVYADISSENSILEIDAKDLEKVSSDEVEYYTENGKLKKVRLSDAVFVKNGAVIGYDVAKKADINKGKIVLISNSGDNRYNTVLVTEYEILVMGHLDSTNKKIHDKYDTSKFYSFDEDKLEEVNIIMNGKNANFMHIEDGDVLSVARSEDGKFITAVISTDVVKGKVEAVYNDGDIVVTIDGKDYVLDDALARRIGDGSSIMGSNVELVLDVTGEGSHIRTAALEGAKVGFVHKYGMTGSGFTEKYALEIYSTDDENKIYTIAEKVSVNDSKNIYDGDDVFALLDNASNPGNIKPQIIKFTLNGEGEISGIITADHSSAMSQTGYLTKILPEGNYTYRSNLINMTTAINDKTLIFQVPYDSFVEEGGYQSYFRKLDKTYLRSSMSYTFEAYKTNDDTPYADVLLCKKAKPYQDDNSDSVGIIRKVSRIQNGSGIDVFALEMFVNGVGVKNITSDICIWKDGEDKDIAPGALKEGDFVRFNTDGGGSVAYIKYLYRPSDKSSKDPLAGMVGSYDARLRLSYHYVADKFEGNEMDSGGIVSLLSLSDSFGGDVTWRLQYSRLNKTIIYDGSKREGSRVYIGNTDNVLSYNGTGGSDASVVITHASIGTFKNVYIIN